MAPQKKWIARLSLRGIPYSVWGYEMPRIPPGYLDCAIYLYRSPEEAAAGVNTGGSGCLVGVPFLANPERCTIYAVTNHHVKLECGPTPAIRLNTVNEVADTITTTKDEWVSHPTADIAACPVQLSPGPDGHKWNFIVPDMFATEAHIDTMVIGPGDDTFMVGRFITVQGKQRNTPALRFGNIAMLPYEKIAVADGIPQESFLVECRSIPGYSGSPVFVYDPHKYKRGTTFAESYSNLKATGPWLLGIDWCHIPNYEPVYDVDKDGRKKKRKGLVCSSNTSMAGVIPAWLLHELLCDPELMEQRNEEDVKISQAKKQDSAVLDNSTEHSAPFTEEEFEKALKKAARRVEPSESDAEKK